MVELIRDLGALEPIDADWRRLAVDRENAFVSPEWFRSWLAQLGEGAAPLVAVCRDGSGAVVGVMPLVAPSARPRLARFAGSGFGDHFQLATAVSREADVATAVGRALREERIRGVLLENVDAGARWPTALARAGRLGNRPLIGRTATLPSISLEGADFEAYLAGRSRNFRSQLRRRRRSLERDHDVRFRWTHAIEEIAEDMATLHRLHEQRWRDRERPSALSGERAAAFLSQFAAACHAQGWLRLCVLEVDGEPVAAWFGWRLGERFSYYQAGFDPRWADRSVGLVLLAETVRVAAEERAREYDLLLGDEDFKRRFANSARHVETLLAAPWLHPTRLLAGAETHVRSASRRLPSRVRDPAKQAAGAVLRRLPLARGS